MQPSPTMLSEIEAALNKCTNGQFQRDALTKLKQSVIQELIDYIHSRGTIVDGIFKPGFFTEQFHDTGLTKSKVSHARDVIKQIGVCTDKSSMRACLEKSSLFNQCEFTVFHLTGSDNYQKRLDAALAKPGL